MLSHHIAESLRSAILTGRLRPGERIRQEELAAEFGASRFPVREALRILETGGLVTMHSNRGAWVTRLDQAECVELYRVREQLEPLLLTDSVPNLSESAIDEIADVLAELEAVDVLAVDDYLELDSRFHLLSYSGSKMESVRSSVERLLQMTHFYRRAYHDLVQAGESRSWILEYDHRLIFDAIRRGDSAEAGIVMGLHTRRARIALQERPEIFDFEASGETSS